MHQVIFSTERIRSKEDLKVGDKLRYTSWAPNDVDHYLVNELVGNNTIVTYKYKIRGNFVEDTPSQIPALAWVSSAHGDYWYKIIDELPYDPTQQGDRDDDI